MLKSLVRGLFTTLGLQVHRLPPASSTSSEPPGPLRFGQFVVEAENPVLLQVYRDFPETNTMIGRLVAQLRLKGPLALIDIGANCGDTLAIAKAAAPDSEVLCVEGDESLAPVLA